MPQHPTPLPSRLNPLGPISHLTALSMSLVDDLMAATEEERQESGSFIAESIERARMAAIEREETASGFDLFDGGAL